jgi:tetratricopeptide (TPR) repeat protein
VRVSPTYAKAHYSLGVLMESSGRNGEALSRYADAVKYDPGYVQARVRLGDSLRRSGRLQESLSEFEQALKIDPRVAEAIFGYAVTLARLGRYAEARDQLIEGMKLEPTRMAFSHALARLLAAAPDEKVRDGRRALTLAQQLLKRERSVAIGETMAMAYAELGQFNQAASLERELMAAAKQQHGPDELLQRMTDNLRLYERRQPNRTPWKTDPEFETGFGPF